MFAVVFILIGALMMFVLSLFLFNGKGAGLIAGYNTLPKEEQARYDRNKLCKAVGCVCLLIALMLCFMAYLGYRIDAGLTDESKMQPFAIVFVVVVILSIVTLNVYVRKKVKK